MHGDARDFEARQKGTKKLVTQFGERLVCVRYRYDAVAQVRYKTVELVIEAVRQIRGQSVNQAKRSDVALVIGGPMVTPASNLLLGSGATL